MQAFANISTKFWPSAVPAEVGASLLLRVSGAALAVGAVTAMRQSLGTWLQAGAPLIPYLLAVSLVALIWGAWPGLLATGLGAFAGVFFFLAPQESFFIDSAADKIHLGLFLVEGSIISIAFGILRQAKNNANQSHAALELALKSGAQASWSLDVPRQKYTFGGAFRAVFGEDLVPGIDGKWWVDHVPPEDAAKLRRLIQSAIDDASGFETTFRFKPSEGTLRWIQICGLVYCDDNGKPLRIMGVNSDITEKRRFEEALAQAKDAAEAASAAKSNFLANMSHEIRTPLGVVLGFSELLANSRLAPDERRQFAELVKRNGQLVSSLINEILDLAKIESGRLDVEVTLVELASILGDVEAVLRLKAFEKGLELTFRSEGELPGWVETDALRLKQILINVVGNAIKFTNSGRVEVVVAASRTKDRTKLEFEVKDSGIGISEEQAAQLFEPFSQADPSTKRRYGGTGLGLAISKRLANLLGGDVVLSRSEVDRGSVFGITVDAGSRDLAMKPLEPAATRFESGDSRASTLLRGAKILIAEDSEDIRLLLKRMLKETRCRVIEAVNGRDAVELAHGNDVDLIVMDLQMPVMDGYEAVALLRRSGFRKPILALSAHAMKSERQRSLQSGFDDYLTKPIDKEQLLDRLTQALRPNA